MQRDEAMHALGVGTERGMRSVVTGIFTPTLTSRAYTAFEKINIWRAKAFLRRETNLLETLFTTRTPDIVPELKTPAYFMSGRYDLTVNVDLSRQYLAELKAPVKGFYTFQNSAHSPIFEEPERFLEIMTQDVLSGRTALADA
jgi:pimeloyl-ACP methyl ester carboxylesterase